MVGVIMGFLPPPIASAKGRGAVSKGTAPVHFGGAHEDICLRGRLQPLLRMLQGHAVQVAEFA